MKKNTYGIAGVQNSGGGRRPMVGQKLSAANWIGPATGVSRPRKINGQPSSGSVFYYQVVSSPANEERGVVQPLSTAERADWAIKVLDAHYPGRQYQAVKLYAPEHVTEEQIQSFEIAVVDDLTKLELADQYRTTS